MSRAAGLLKDGLRSCSDHVSSILPEEATINWYPGHMAKASAHISHRLSNCSHIIELRDSRIPLSSANESLDDIISVSVHTRTATVGGSKSQTSESKERSSPSGSQHRSDSSSDAPKDSTPKRISKLKRIIVFNKTDMADDRVNDKWRTYFLSQRESIDSEDEPIWMSLSSEGKKGGGDWSTRQRKAYRTLLNRLYLHPLAEVNQMGQRVRMDDAEVEERLVGLGKFGGGALPFQPHVSLVVGVPNVGKSTLINQLTGRRGAVVTPRPATTRSIQLFKIDASVGGSGFSSSSRDASSGRTASRTTKSGIKLTPREISLPESGSQLSLSRGIQNPMSTPSSDKPVLWIMDTPGVMMPSNLETERGLKLALCGNVADKIVPGTYVTLAKYLHHLLFTLPYAPKPEHWLSKMKLQHSEYASSALSPPPAFDSSFLMTNYHSLMDQICKVYGKMDEHSAAEFFVLAFRSGKLGQFSLEVPPL